MEEKDIESVMDLWNEKVRVYWFIWNFENDNSEWFWNDNGLFLSLENAV